MATNTGNQTITLLYHSRADSATINRRFADVRKTGIYSGGYLTVVDNTHARLSTLTCEISDGTYQVKISTGSTVTVTVASATPYVVLRWSYSGSETNDYASISAVATPATNDLVVGKCTFTGGGNLQGFSYSERTTPDTLGLFLKVEPTEDTELRVRVRAGRIQNGKETIQISDQKSGVFTPPLSNSKVYLVYVNRATGVITIDSSGTAAASPVAPSYAGKLVLAEVTLASTSTNITSSMIEDVRDFTNMSYDPDGDTIEVDSNGKLSVTSSVIGQASQAIGTTNISTSSSAFADMDNMTISLTTTGGDVLLMFNASFRGTGVGLRFSLDNSSYYGSVRSDLPSNYRPVGIHWLLTSLSAGSHTFKVQWERTLSGTQYQDGATYSRVFTAIELPN
jgi:hypothetical protein